MNYFSILLISKFFSFLLYIGLLSLFSIVLLSVSIKISVFFSPDSEKISEYECGFEPFDSATRQPFDVHFYIVGILFLIFDVEIALLFPWCASFIYLSNLSFLTGCWFFIVLIIGLIFEWNLGILEWPYNRN
jgi:NADH-quinone oxidoreductase subunit A